MARCSSTERYYNKIWLREELHRRRSRNILNHGRKQTRMVTGLFTGYCGLKQHLHRMGILTDDAGTLWFTKDEAVEHILSECETLTGNSLRYIRLAFLTCEEVISASLGSLIKFLDKVMGNLEGLEYLRNGIID